MVPCQTHLIVPANHPWRKEGTVRMAILLFNKANWLLSFVNFYLQVGIFHQYSCSQAGIGLYTANFEKIHYSPVHY